MSGAAVLRRRATVAFCLLVAAVAGLRSGPAFAADPTTTTTTRPAASSTTTTATTVVTTTSTTRPATTTTAVGPSSTTSTTSTSVVPDGSTTSTSTTTSTTTKPGPNAPLVPLTPPGRLPSDLVNSLRELTSQYEDATAEELDLAKRVLASEDQLDALTTQVEQLNLSLVDLQGKLARAEQSVKDADRVLDDRNLRLLGAQEDLDKEQAHLRAQAVESYIGGGSGDAGANAALRASSLNDVGKTLVYADAVVADQRTQVQRVSDARDLVENGKHEADAARDGAVKARDDVTVAKAGLVAQRDQQSQLQAQVKISLDQQHQLLEEVTAKREQYAKRIAAMTAVSDGISGTLEKAQAGQTLPNPSTGILSNPLASMVINSPFGPRSDPLLGNPRVHSGVDLNGSMGTPILAAADGIVLIASEQGGYGNCTVIDHGSGIGTLYGHQSEFKVQVGDVVKRGQVIGLVGSTGHSTGAHLHFEVRQFGQPVNPVPFLR